MVEYTAFDLRRHPARPALTRRAEPANMSITRNSVLAFVPQATNIFVGIATSIITARYLGPSGRGVLSLALLAVGVMLLVADLGVSSSVTYFVSKGRMEEKQAIGFSVAAALMLGLLGLAAAALLWPLLESSAMKGVTIQEFLVALAAGPPMLFAQFWMRMSMAKGRFVPVMRYQIAVSVGTLVIVVAVLLGAGLDVLQLLAAISLMHVVLSTILLATDARRHGITFRISRDLLKDIASYGMRTYVGGLVNYAVLRIDAFILNAYTNTTQVGQYTIAVTLTEKLWLVDSSVGHATMPEVVSRERDDAARVVAAANRNVILITVVVGLALFLLAPLVIGLLYGEDYLPAVAPLRILVPGVIAYASGRTLLQYHQGQLARPGIASAVLGVAAIVGVGLYLLLIPAYGMTGAALASTITYTLVFVVALTLFTRASGVGLAETLVPRGEDVRRYWTWLKSLLRRGSRTGADSDG
jgi:O-antigen/teichoic acid export membrane protein